jgi:ADP-ribose pyrophosphatase
MQKTILHEGKWIKICSKPVVGRSGIISTWEFVERKESHEEGDSVDIVALYKDYLVLIASFRYPVQSFVLEFPAGLTEGASPQQTALKELKEETGFIAFEENIKEVSPVLFTDPWKSTETTRLVVVEVPDILENESPEQSLEDEEIIIVELVKLQGLCENIIDLAQRKSYGIDVRLYLFAKGMQDSSNYSP